MDRPNYFLTVLTPIADGPDSGLEHRLALERALEDLRAQPDCPFASCDMVHMARFVIIDELPLQLGDTRREFLSRNYLLFIAELSGNRDDFFDALYDGDEPFVRSIWGHCAGFPRYLTRTRDLGNGGRPEQHGSVYFRRYMQRHEIRTLIPFAAVAGVSVNRIQQAVATQSELAQFIEDHPPWSTSDQDLYDDWRATFGFPQNG